MALAVILSAGFVGWLVWRAIRGMETKTHLVMYVLCAISGVYAIVFFMTMAVPSVAKVLVAIAIGVFLIWLASRQQRKKQQKQP